MSNSLTENDRHLLRLIERIKKNDGWAFQNVLLATIFYSDSL